MKRFAPILITVLIGLWIVLWGVAIFVGSIFTVIGIPLGVLVLLASLGLVAALVANLVHLMKEIDDEDKDDLSKY